ncbi:hypothetical protein E3J61_00860 [Candidatus Dependentiae bacterium]|nr:MAG: hypothetical protein E3J61_00860 [Candidatus Dependentiae bacterium]
MIKKLILALFCGIIGTLFVAQNDPWVHQQIGNAFKTIYARAFHCTVTGNVEGVDFVHPHITLSNFSLSSSDGKGNWAWTAQQYHTGFSWPFFLLHRTIDMWVSAKNLTVTTDMYDGTPSITPHIKALMSVPDLPIKIILKSTQIKNVSLSIIGEDTQARLCWDSNSQRTPSALTSRFYLKQGTITHQQQTIAHSLRGTLSTEVKTDPKNSESVIAINGQIDLPQLGEYPTCFITGTWHNDRGRFNVQSIDKALRINPLILTQKDSTLQFNTSASFPVAYFINLLTKSSTSPIQGSCVVHAQGSLDPEGQCEGYVACEDLTNPWFTDRSVITCSFKKQQSNLHGSVNLRTGTRSSWHGLFDWNGIKESGSCQLYNNISHPIPYSSRWFIQPHDATIDVSYHKPTNRFDLLYHTQATNSLTNATFDASGTIHTHKQNTIEGNGSFGSYRYEVTSTPAPPYLQHLTLYDAKGESLVTVVYDEQKNNHTTHIAMPLIRTINTKIFDHEMHGEGTVKITSHIKENKLYAQIGLKDATIRLPQTYNFINGFDASIEADISTKRITLRNIQCTLHSGSVYSPCATIWLDAQGALQFAHVPLLIDHCLFTIKQDLFTMISGYLLFAQQPHEKGCLSGHIMFDRAQLKENLFSQQEQKKLFHAASSLQEIPQIPLTCNISIETKDPIRVDTRFLQADAEVNLHVCDAVTKPRVSGTITISSGSINFPYKPLQISKGEITFVEDQLFNPAVELVAKNRIKNHNITLNVAGSVQNHAILLDATPPLTDQQIVSLLLTGAHEESLTAVIPALLMQNVSNFIFSSHKSDFFDSYIKPFMKQISVKLKPEFNDQTGRGGLRGALEITVNERWRALIEKNFSLTEDTRFELEYMLSDDVTFRVIRDERRDVGGEVEMKWKF